MLENVRSRLIQIVRCHAHTIQKRATAPFSETPVRKGLQGCLQSGLGASPAARRTRSHHRPFRHPSGSRLTRYGSEKVRFGSRTCPTYHVARASAWHACATCARAATCICVRACTLHGTRIFELTTAASGVGGARLEPWMEGWPPLFPANVTVKPPALGSAC